MFDFSVISMAFRIATQNCTSKFYNLSNFIPILTCDTSMSLWLNSLMFYIKSFLFGGGHNFNPFSCSISLQMQRGRDAAHRHCGGRNSWDRLDPAPSANAAHPVPWTGPHAYHSSGALQATVRESADRAGGAQ